MTPDFYANEQHYTCMINVLKNGKLIETHRLDDLKLYSTSAPSDYGQNMETALTFKYAGIINSKFIPTKGIECR